MNVEQSTNSACWILIFMYIKLEGYNGLKPLLKKKKKKNQLNIIYEYQLYTRRNVKMFFAWNFEFSVKIKIK